ncbi:FAD-dependent oxidoreductase [Streptomyces sp. SudanB66_2053]|uniref:FAD-dependent oxidoreductase n=1 Tax=Streptomyces sp. SudanB66_2053 TaxID=3035277 RepID=UPI003F5492AF
MAEPRVAVVGPFSGLRAAWGELLERGAAAHQGVTWDLYDDQGVAAIARQVAEAVVAENRYSLVIGHFNSAGARAALPVYKAASLPILLPLATAPRLLTDPSGLALRWCADDIAQLMELHAAALRGGHTRLAVTDDDSTYGAVLSQLLQSMAGGATTEAASLESDATALVVCGTHAGAARVARDYRAKGFDGALYFTDDCAVDEFSDLLGDAVGTAWVARLRGGASAHVDSAFRTAVTALTAEPSLRGPDLLSALRAAADRTFTPEGEPAPDPSAPGWEVVPLAAPTVASPARASGRRRDGKVYDVLVVGAGAVGAACADVLARQGLRVGMTAPSVADPAATSYSGGLIRAYEPDPILRELALRSYRMTWGASGGEVPPTGFRQTGSLVLLGEGDVAEAERGVAELRASGVRASLLSPGDIRSRFPRLTTRDVVAAVWEPGGGYADPPVMARGCRDRASAHGAVIVPGRVTRIEEQDRGPVRVELEQNEVRTRVVVMAAGVGAVRIAGHRLSELAVDAVPRTRRIRYAFFQHSDSQGMPAIVDLVTGVWGRSHHTSSAGCAYLTGRPSDEWGIPPGGGDTVTTEQAEFIRELAVTRWPWLAKAEFLSGRHGVDLFTDDGRPFLGPQAPGSSVVLAAGWSGSGFKTAPAAAESVAAHVREILGG